MADLAVIRLSSLGDIILTEPVTRALRELFPGAKINFITRGKFREVVQMFPAVDEVISFEIPGRHQDFCGLVGSVRQLPIRPELTLDLQKNMRSWMIKRALRCRKVLTYRKARLRRQMAVWLKRKHPSARARLRQDYTRRRCNKLRRARDEQLHKGAGKPRDRDGCHDFRRNH